MSQLLNISNFGSLNVLETTRLTTDVAIAATALPVENPQNFTTGQPIVVGLLASETSELVLTTGAPSGSNITAGALVRAHTALDPVTLLFGDKLVIYRAPNVDGSVPADNAFSVLATIDVDVDQASTSYTDAAGGADYWYKFVYKNSVSNATTDLANATAAHGGTANDYCSISAIRDEAGFSNNRNITDETIDQHRQAAQAEINGKLSGRFIVPFTAPINAYIADLTKRLAAGFLLLSQFGAYTVSDSYNGQTRVDKVRAELKDLQEGNSTLVGVASAAIGGGSTGANGGFDAWPNSNTASADGDVGGGERMFRVSDISGNGGQY